MKSGGEVGHPETLFFACQCFHAFLSRAQIAEIRDRHGLEDKLLNIWWLQKLKFAKRCGRFNRHPYRNLDFYRETLFACDLLKALVVEELLHFLHRWLP